MKKRDSRPPLSSIRVDLRADVSAIRSKTDELIRALREAYIRDAERAVFDKRDKGEK